MIIDIGAGNFHIHTFETGTDVSVILTTQLRTTGHLESILLLTSATDDLDNFANIVSHALPVPPTVSPKEAADGYNGIWQRVPGALRRQPKALWHKHLHPGSTRILNVQIPTLNINEVVSLPTVLPRESSIGKFTTSGFLSHAELSLVRISTSQNLNHPGGPQFRVEGPGLLGMTHSNGPNGLVDGVATLERVPTTLSLQLDQI